MSTRVAIERVEAELIRLWGTAGPDKKGVTRIETMNVVALCETPDHAERAQVALAAAAALHGARTLLVTWRDGDAPGFTADVGLHASVLSGKPGGEEIRLEARGRARQWIPDTVGRLLAAHLPTYVWWVGDLPDDDDLLSRVAQLAQLVIVSSSDMDLRDLPALDQLVAQPLGRSVLADFTWHRVRTWQELTARFFDEPRCVQDLARVERVTLRYQPRASKPEPVSNQAALFAGWLSARLGWKLDAWTSRDPATARLTREGGALELRFEATPRDGVLPGALIEVDLATADSAFHVCRAEGEPSVLCWTAQRPGVPFPEQCVRVGIPDDAKMLGRVLERPIGDPLFEASLHAAAQLVAEIAPRA